MNIFPDEAFQISENLAEDEKFWEIIPLSKIDLSHNKINVIPDLFDTSLCETLQILKIRENVIENLPITLFQCIKLKELDIAVNSLSNLPPSIGNLNDLRILCMFRNSLQNLPKSIINCQLLQNLDCSENQLNELPDPFYFPNLIQLNLKRNNLTTIPKSLCHMTSLEQLDISENQLSDSTSNVLDFTRLTSLKVVDISQNKLSKFPWLPQQGVLDRIHIGYNKIETMNIKSLLFVQNNLTELLIHNNKLASIPPELSLCLKCKVLDFSNNDISDLPAAVGYMPSLQRFAIEGNPIRTIRRTLLTQSTEDLKKYLKTRGPPVFLVDQSDDSNDDNMDSSNNNTFETKTNQSYGSINNKSTDKNIIVNTSVLDYDTKESDFQQDLLQRIRMVQNNTCILDLTRMNLSYFPLNDINNYLQQRNLNSYQHILQLNVSNNNLTWNCLETCVFTSFAALLCLNLNNNQLGVHSNNNSNNSISNKLNHNNNNMSNNRNNNNNNNNNNNMSNNINTSSSSSSTTSQLLLPSTLRILDLSSNHLNSQDLNRLLLSLRCLTDLNICNNDVTHLPSELCICYELRELRCSHNKIESVDNITFSVFKNLENIDIGDNRLSTVDKMAQELAHIVGNNNNNNNSTDNSNNNMPSKIKSINLKNNNISQIPYHFCYCPQLTYLGLHGNPQKAIRSSIIDNTDAILKCLRNKIPTTSATANNNNNNNNMVNEQFQNLSFVNNPTTAHPSSSSQQHHQQSHCSNRSDPYEMKNEFESYSSNNNNTQQQKQQRSNTCDVYNNNSSRCNNDSNNSSSRYDNAYPSPSSYQQQQQQQQQKHQEYIRSLQKDIFHIEQELETSVSISTTRKLQLKKQLASNKAELARSLS